MLTEPELLAIIYAFGLGADATVPIGIPHLGYLEQRPATRFSTKPAITGGNDISATHGPAVASCSPVNSIATTTPAFAVQPTSY